MCLQVLLNPPNILLWLPLALIIRTPISFAYILPNVHQHHINSHDFRRLSIL